MGLEQITSIAAASPIARHSWTNRGVAPAGYIKGMTVVYARVFCKLKAGDPAAVEMAKANTGSSDHDALAWYEQQFQDLGMDNSAAGPDTLRHLFTLMIGMGMRESSGQYCVGRDTTATNMTADTAEAGLFQTSFNARIASPLMSQLFTSYANSTDFLEIFQQGVRCKPADLENFGDGDGQEFQRLSKACPAFAAEFTAVGLRNIRKHWGTINSHASEVLPDCDAMLLAVQNEVEASSLCSLVLGPQLRASDGS